MLQEVKTILRGIGQIMLQENALTGLLFLVGILFNSRIMFLGALVGLLAGTLTAHALKYDKEEIKRGLYGFNGALVGIAMFCFYEFGFESFFLAIFGSALSSVVMHFMHKKNPFPFTFPFIISTWAIMLVNKYANLVGELSAGSANQTQSLGLLSSLSMGFGQVMFQASIVTGVIFLIAILINSRISALGALLGSVLGMATAVIFSWPMNLINVGLFGYNAVLCGIAFSEKKKLSFIFVFFSTVLSALIIKLMMVYNLPALTFPFVLSSWIILVVRYFVTRPKKTA